MEQYSITFDLAGRAYSGTASWEDDVGLKAELRFQLEAGEFPIPPTMPAALIATLNTSRRVLLIRPYFTDFGSIELDRDAPGFAGCNLRVEAMLLDLAWSLDAEVEVENIEVKSNALSLWYGERPRIEWSSAGVSATFNWKTVAYTTDYGTLVIAQGIKGPPTPALGKYHFEVRPSATMVLNEKLSVAAAAERAMAIDGFFDLLASFPRRAVEVRVRLKGMDRFMPMWIAVASREEAIPDHPFNVFISRAQGIGLGRIFSTYLDNYAKRHLLQHVLRYLSATRLTVPDGFLTACNVIESIGKPDPDSDTVLEGELDNIEEVLGSANPTLGKRFSEIRKKISHGSSFQTRFKNSAAILSNLGLNVTLKSRPVQEARARHRHDIKDLTDDDLKAMQPAVGFAWVLGMVWLCRSIGIPDAVLRTSLSYQPFHRMRGTQLWGWGKIDAPTEEAGAAADPEMPQEGHSALVMGIGPWDHGT